MNVKKVTLVVSGTLLAFAIAAAPTSKKQEVPALSQPTAYSADHARIQGEPAEPIAQF